MRFLDNLNKPTYAAFRMVLGFLFLCHGTQKLFGFPIDFPYPLNPMSTTAAFIELVCGTLVMIGFYSRYAAFVASGTMAVGYWMVHGMNNLFPIANGGELAAIYCFGFLFIAANGPGIWSANKK
ncbi:MAG: DoxX family protein [Hahellaceae bacterium]|nr:DoxX family protein [Hahellaceae bacterium]MCP5170594.1 DoxX family protein [Hahellaceae bacterium]